VHEPDPAAWYLETLREHLPLLARKFHIRSLGLFGSYVRHEQRSGSDLDILVSFEEQPSLLTFLALENHLSDLLGVKVDLVMKDALKPHLGKRILNEVVPV
jgi:uncharacterized protein